MIGKLPTKPAVRAMSGAADIGATFPVMQQLRPHLARDTYEATVGRMMAGGFLLAAVIDGADVLAVAGYRIQESLAWGRHVYVDDLVVTDGARSRGCGALLFDWLKNEARAQSCRELHLDSGVNRHGAHRFYLRERMDIIAYHFKLGLD